jgi:hypothetical protein
MSNQLLPNQRREAARLGWMAVGGWAASGLAVYWSWGGWTILPLIGAAWLTWRWFQFRAKWGMRF